MGCVQCCTVRPFLYEYEVPRILLVDVKIVRHAQRFFFGSCHKLSVKRHDILNMFRLDEILSNNF